MNSGDLLKRAFLIGLGATVSTAEKLGKSIKELADELAAQGELKAADGKKLVDELRKMAESAIQKAQQSTTKKPAKKKPVTKKPAVKKAAPKKPAAKKDVKKTSAKKPAAKKAAPKKPVKKK